MLELHFAKNAIRATKKAMALSFGIDSHTIPVSFEDDPAFGFMHEHAFQAARQIRRYSTQHAIAERGTETFKRARTAPTAGLLSDISENDAPQKRQNSAPSRLQRSPQKREWMRCFGWRFF